MDDLAPIFLYLLVKSEKFPAVAYSSCKFCLLSLSAEQRMQNEGRVVALLEGALRILLEEWDSQFANPS